MKIKRCPNCGSTIEISFLYQYSHDYLLGRHGKLQKKYRSRDHGSMEIALACCTNENCNTTWEVDDFFIDENNEFVDLKYTKGSDDK